MFESHFLDSQAQETSRNNPVFASTATPFSTFFAHFGGLLASYMCKMLNIINLYYFSIISYIAFIIWLREVGKKKLGLMPLNSFLLLSLH